MFSNSNYLLTMARKFTFAMTLIALFFSPFIASSQEDSTEEKFKIEILDLTVTSTKQIFPEIWYRLPIGKVIIKGENQINFGFDPNIFTSENVIQFGMKKFPIFLAFQKNFSSIEKEPFRIGAEFELEELSEKTPFKFLHVGIFTSFEKEIAIDAKLRTKMLPLGIFNGFVEASNKFNQKIDDQINFALGINYKRLNLLFGINERFDFERREKEFLYPIGIRWNFVKT